MNGRFVHVADDGTQADVTEGVLALYRFAFGVADEGVMCWPDKDAAAVALIARTAELERADEAERLARTGSFL